MAVDVDYVQDLFAAFGPVDVRRMFGGAGIFADGLMFALISDGVIYLKADAAGTAAFECEGSTPFSYAVEGGRRAVMSYWRLPERLYDEPEELARWAHTAMAAARQADAAAAARTSKRRR